MATHSSTLAWEIPWTEELVCNISFNFITFIQLLKSNSSEFYVTFLVIYNLHISFVKSDCLLLFSTRKNN